MKKTFLIIDAFGILYRYHFIFLKRPLINSKGQNVSSINGFLRTYFSLINTYPADYTAIALDSSRKTFRSEIYKAYKENRESMPDDLRSQIPILYNLIDALGITRIVLDNYEADDIIGCIAQNNKKENIKTIIYSPDKDILQLVDDNTKVIASNKDNELVEYDINMVKEKRGVFPNQIIDLLSLMGDASDNIPGVKGIGEKTAVKLLEEYDSLDNIYKNIDSIKGKIQEKLITDKDNAYMSYELAAIKREIEELNIDYREIEKNKINIDEVNKILDDLELKQIRDKINSYIYGSSSNKKGKISSYLSIKDYKVSYHLIKNKTELKNLLNDINNNKFICINFEYEEFYTFKDTIIGISFAMKSNEAFYLDLSGKTNIDKEKCINLVFEVLANKDIKIIGHNLLSKSNTNIAKSFGNLYFDTMIASLVFDNKKYDKYNIDDLALSYLSYKMLKNSDSKYNAKKTLLDLDIKDIVEYGCENVDIIFRLYEYFKNSSFQNHFFNIEMSIVKIFSNDNSNYFKECRRIIYNMNKRKLKNKKLVSKFISRKIFRLLNINKIKRTYKYNNILLFIIFFKVKLLEYFNNNSYLFKSNSDKKIITLDDIKIFINNYLKLDEVNKKYILEYSNIPPYLSYEKIKEHLINIAVDFIILYNIPLFSYFIADKLKTNFKKLYLFKQIHYDDIFNFVKDDLNHTIQKMIFNNIGKKININKDINSKKITASENTNSSYYLIENEIELQNLLKDIEAKKLVCIDFETTGLDTLTDEIIGISFAIKSKEAFYLDLSGRTNIDKEACKKLVFDTLAKEDIKIIGHNLKYEYKMMRAINKKMGNMYFDTMVAAYLINPSRGRYNMDDLALSYLSYNTIKYSDITDNAKKTLLDVELKDVVEYACEDADITFRFYEYFAPLLNTYNLEDLFFNVEMPLISVLADMEFDGVYISTEKMKSLSEEYASLLEKTKAKIYEKAGEEFNLQSPKQLEYILFEKLKINSTKKTKTGANSTDEEVLKDLARSGVKIAEYMLTYRKYSKLKNTYLDVFPTLVHKKTNRIHAFFNQTVTATGRLSSSEPNLQNIPARGDEGKDIRNTFIAEKGNVLIAADYSQIELRLLAHFSNDPVLVEAFKNNDDIHRKTAMKIYSVSKEHVTPSMRNTAKIINFSIIYGKTAFGLSKELNISRKEADDFIKGYFSTYSQVKPFCEKVIEDVKAKGYVRTMLGRIRDLSKTINSSNAVVRNEAERMALNTLIQGSAADMIKVAMIAIHKEFKNHFKTAKIVMQVHDELVVEVSEKEADKAMTIMKEIMEHSVKTNVPITVDIHKGLSWGDIH